MSSLEGQPELAQSASGLTFSKTLSIYQSINRLAMQTKQLALPLGLKLGSCFHIWSSTIPPLLYQVESQLVHMEAGLQAADMVFSHRFMA